MIFKSLSQQEMSFPLPHLLKPNSSFKGFSSIDPPLLSLPSELIDPFFVLPQPLVHLTINMLYIRLDHESYSSSIPVCLD